MLGHRHGVEHQGLLLLLLVEVGPMRVRDLLGHGGELEDFRRTLVRVQLLSSLRHLTILLPESPHNWLSTHRRTYQRLLFVSCYARRDDARHRRKTLQVAGRWFQIHLQIAGLGLGVGPLSLKHFPSGRSFPHYAVRVDLGVEEFMLTCGEHIEKCTRIA